MIKKTGYSLRCTRFINRSPTALVLPERNGVGVDLASVGMHIVANEDFVRVDVIDAAVWQLPLDHTVAVANDEADVPSIALHDTGVIVQHESGRREIVIGKLHFGGVVVEATKFFRAGDHAFQSTNRAISSEHFQQLECNRFGDVIHDNDSVGYIRALPSATVVNMIQHHDDGGLVVLAVFADYGSFGKVDDRSCWDEENQLSCA